MKIIFAGTPLFASSIFKQLIEAEHQIVAVLTQPDQKQGRGQKMCASPVKEVASALGIPVFCPTALKDDDLLGKLQSFEPQLLVVVAYGLILPSNWLTLAPMGAINVHASLLPAWRGASPIVQSILHGDGVTGISLMQMDDGLDTGPVLVRATWPITPETTAGQLSKYLSKLGGELLVDLLMKPSAEWKYQPQDAGSASYAPKIRKNDGLIDWRMPASHIVRCIRAYDPWPGTFTNHKGVRVKIWAGEQVAEKISETPGTLLTVRPDGLIVAAQDGCVHITRLQLPGKKIMTVAELLNGMPHLFKQGDILGT